MRSNGHMSLWEAIGARRDAWSRAAARLHELALSRGVAIDEQALIFSDVHDLQAMEWRLAHSKRSSAHA